MPEESDDSGSRPFICSGEVGRGENRFPTQQAKELDRRLGKYGTRTHGDGKTVMIRNFPRDQLEELRLRARMNGVRDTDASAVYWAAVQWIRVCERQERLMEGGEGDV